jgi:hypothetical protein
MLHIDREASDFAHTHGISDSQPAPISAVSYAALIVERGCDSLVVG